MPFDYFVLIPDETGERVLITPTESGWSLPHLAIADNFWWQDVGPVNRAAREQLDLGATTLCCFRIIHDAAAQAVRHVFALEPQQWNGHLPENGRWVSAAELEGVNLSVPEQRATIADWLTQSTDAVPWYRPGWQAEPLHWAREQLAGLGFALIGEPVQVRSWERSSLWHFPTANGLVYFKAVAEAFGYEPKLSQALAEWATEHVAPVLAVEPERRWLLMGGAGQNSLLRDRDPAHWEAALRQYAQLQIALSPRVDDLLALGVPDRRLETLPGYIEALLADTAALKNSPTGLADDEIASLRRCEPELHAACRALAASGIPASLEHGDFASGQIMAVPNGGYRFIDWSDSSLSFPFFSLLFFWAELEGSFDDLTGVPERLRAAYLEPWTAFASVSELVELYQLAMRVAPLHHALIYHRTILPTMKVKWEMECMVPYYLRIGLRGQGCP
jgi:hypothetical protein